MYELAEVGDSIFILKDVGDGRGLVHVATMTGSAHECRDLAIEMRDVLNAGPSIDDPSYHPPHQNTEPLQERGKFDLQVGSKNVFADRTPRGYQSPEERESNAVNATLDEVTKAASNLRDNSGVVEDKPLFEGWKPATQTADDESTDTIP